MPWPANSQPTDRRCVKLPAAGAILALACAMLAVPARVEAARWKLTGQDSEMNLETGKGRIQGPVTLRSEKWTFAASREALILAKFTIVKEQAEGAKPSYGLDSRTARIVFIGQCEARNHAGKVVLQAPFMIFDVEEGKLIGQGGGVSYLEADGTMKALGTGSSVSIDLASGVPVRTDATISPDKK